MKKVIARICVFFFCFVFISCSNSQKTDVLMIVDGDNVRVKGNKVEFELSPDGKYVPKLWVPDYIMVCRSDGEARGNQYKAGFAYRITKELKLEQICPVDLNLSDKQLQERFLKEPK